ncbi:MAG: hypothetical protein M3357_11945 [Actinomycetota bacterium]|nr:hypothetical protein [Actinomycetota bacterium]
MLSWPGRVDPSATAPAAGRARSASAMVVSVSHGGSGGPTGASTASWLAALGGGPESAVTGVLDRGFATAAGGSGLATVVLVTFAAGGGFCGGTTGDFGPLETGAFTVDVVGPT